MYIRPEEIWRWINVVDSYFWMARPGNYLRLYRLRWPTARYAHDYYKVLISRERPFHNHEQLIKQLAKSTFERHVQMSNSASMGSN